MNQYDDDAHDGEVIIDTRDPTHIDKQMTHMMYTSECFY